MQARSGTRNQIAVEIVSKACSRKALLTSNIHLTDTDGKSLRVLSLAEVLNRAGFKVTLIVSTCDSTTARKFSIIETKARLGDTLFDNLPKKVLHFTRQFFELLSFYAKLLILAVNCDVVVSSLVGPEIDSLFACMLSRIKRVPFIYDYDDPSPEIRLLLYKSPHDLRVKLSLFSRNILIRNACLVLTWSWTSRRQILGIFGKTKRVYTWYNSPRIEDLHISDHKKGLRRELGLSAKSFIVSYLGNVPRWGIESHKKTLIGCAGYLKPDEDVLFLIIGGGWWEQHYCKLIKKLHLTDRVLVTGKRPRQNALEYLAASDVTCFPFAATPVSMHIVPTKLFESMALGIPVLSTRLPNFVQILGDDGIYFDGNPADLAKQVRWCMMNWEKLDAIASNLKSRYQHEYKVEKELQSLAAVLRAVLE